MSYPDNQQQKKTYPKGVFDIPKLGLRTRNRSGEFARLLFGMDNSVPTITLFTGNRDEDRKGIVRVRLGMDNYGALLVVVSEAILFKPTEAEPEFKRAMKTSRKIKNDQGRYTNLPDATVMVGRDKEGVIYLAVMKEGHEDIRFDFKSDDTIKWYRGRGEEMAKGEVSEIYCAGWLRDITTLMPVELSKNFKEEHLSTNSPNRNGGYQNNSGRSGNYGRQNGGNYDRNAGRSNQGTDGGKSYGDNYGGSGAAPTPAAGGDFGDDDLPF